MSKSLDLGERKRGQTLIIVEGNHEKNELFQSLFNSFPELSIMLVADYNFNLLGNN